MGFDFWSWAVQQGASFLLLSLAVWAFVTGRVVALRELKDRDARDARTREDYERRIAELRAEYQERIERAEAQKDALQKMIFELTGAARAAVEVARKER